MPIGLAWRNVRDRFRAAGLDTPDLDARLLAQRAFGLDAMQLVHRERDVTPEPALTTFEGFAARRLNGEPVTRILGVKEFWGLEFTLGDATLVPRPETEMLVRRGYEFLAERTSPTILDLGTGTGAIAIALLTQLPDARAIAVDISPEAIRIARANAERHGVARRLETLEGSWFGPLAQDQKLNLEKFDLIVSNPPYIATAVIETLQPEVKLHDPRLALDGGWDGLEAYRAIAAEAARRLRPDGVLLLEIGATQAQTVVRLVSRAGFLNVSVEKDLAGLDRMVSATHS